MFWKKGWWFYGKSREAERYEYLSDRCWKLESRHDRLLDYLGLREIEEPAVIKLKKRSGSDA